MRRGQVLVKPVERLALSQPPRPLAQRRDHFVRLPWLAGLCLPGGAIKRRCSGQPDHVPEKGEASGALPASRPFGFLVGARKDEFEQLSLFPYEA
jgi:hypothetical protein